MQDLTAMALFVHVVEQGSFTAAASHLGAPLSTVSRRIAALEASLGVRLLERTTRSLRLTEIGESYYAHCRRGLQEFDSANLLVRNRQNDVAGLLRISIPPNLAEDLFVPVVNAFQADFPKARVSVFVTERHVDLIADGIDLAFRVGELRDSGLTARRVAEFRPRLVAAPAYLATHGAPASPQQLSQHRIVAFGDGRAATTWRLTGSRSSDTDAAVTVKLEPDLTMNDYRGILHAVRAGAGIAEIPDVICAGSIDAGDLMPVLDGWTFAPVDLTALHAGNRHASRLVRLFLDACITAFKQLP